MAVLLREALGESLRRVRTEQGRTLREVSTNARVSLGYLSEVERGQKEASSELLAAICDSLEIELADILLDVGHALSPRTVAAGTAAAPAGVVPAADTALADEHALTATVVIPAPAGHPAAELAAA